MPPSPYEKPSALLEAQIKRDFGSMEDFQRALGHMTADARRGGDVWLVLTPGGRLRLVHTPPNRRPRGLPLFRFPVSPPPPPPGGPRPPHRPPMPPRPDWREINGQYERHMGRRPPYPTP